MLFLFRVIIIFLIIFNIRIPILYNTVILSMLLTSIYYLFVHKSFPFDFFFSKYTVRILIGIIAMMLICYSVTKFHGESDYEIIRVLAVEFLMVFAMIYVSPLLIGEHRSNVFEYIVMLICLAYALQGIIQLLGFMVPAIGDFLISISPYKEEIIDGRLSSQAFRSYALAGYHFFGLACGFGSAFILFFKCLFSEKQTFIKGYKAYIIFTLLMVGAAFAGRTAWVGLVTALAMSVVFLFIKKPKRIFYQTMKAIVIMSVALLLIYNVFLTPAIKNQLETTIFPFAFEFFYSYEEDKEFRTSSTDVLIENFYYSLPYETVMYGKGKFFNLDGSYFGHTDAGYMRTIMFGGILFTLSLIIYQSLYFLKPLALARKGEDHESKMDFIFFLTLFVTMFIFEYKGLIIGNNKAMDATFCLIGIAYITKYFNSKTKSI